MESGNIILIGMAGAGKSTIGVLLAKELGKQFIDTDLLIQNQENRLLQEIVDAEGSDGLRAIESDLCQRFSTSNAVVATGGSVVYSPEAMENLKAVGQIVWLKVPFSEIDRRINNMGSRGLAIKPGQTLKDLFNEREPLYETFAERTINCESQSEEEVVAAIKNALG